jgi:hypothetical protein
MSITLTRIPFDTVPAKNDLWVMVATNQFFQPNFKFVFTITETNTGVSKVDRVDLTGTSSGYYNAYDFVKSFVKTGIKYGQDGWFDGGYVSPTESAINEFTIDIDEEYGSTPSIHTGSSFSFYAWNASLTRRERADYLPTQYDNSTTGPVWLQNFQLPSLDVEPVKVKRDQDIIFQFLQTGGVPVDSVSIEVFDIDNNSINTFTIDNNHTGDLMLGFNSGIESLEQLYVDAPGLFSVVPTSPLFDDDAVYFTVLFTNANGFRSTRFEINEGCGMYYNKTLMYLNRFGGYDFVNLYGNHKKKHNIIKTSYKGINEVSDFQESHSHNGVDTIANNPLSNPDRVLSNNYIPQHTLESDWLTDLQRIDLSDLFGTPHVFFNFGYQDYQNLNIAETEFKFSTPLIDKLVNLQVTVSEPMERRQGS